jgi:hypothetical protein
MSKFLSGTVQMEHAPIAERGCLLLADIVAKVVCTGGQKFCELQAWFGVRI